MEYIHGGDVYTRDIEIDFSANINPLGMPKCARDALKKGISLFERYPDVNSAELTEKISEYEKVDKECIYCSNGAIDIIFKIVFGLKPKKALLAVPSFYEYENALKNSGCEITYEFLKEEEEFVLSESLLEKIPKADIIFLCNPNNPVGNLIEPKLLNKIVSTCAQSDTQLVIDECFMDFIDEKEIYSAKKILEKNIIIIKAFTKIFAMAGLRLGYMLSGNKNLIKSIKETSPCWNVSVPAQIAGAAAFDDLNYIQNTAELIKGERKYLEENLRKLGFKVFKGKANFILFKTDLDILHRLFEKKIAIRSCENFMGLNKGFYRIAVRRREDNTKLIRELERIIKNG